MMLGHQHHPFEAPFFGCIDNLTGVESCRIEQSRICISVTPLLVFKSGRGKMNQDIPLHFMPAELIRIGESTVRNGIKGLLGREP